MLSVLLRYTDSDYLFGIFKLFFWYSGDNSLNKSNGDWSRRLIAQKVFRPTKNNFNSGVSEQKILMCFFFISLLGRRVGRVRHNVESRPTKDNFNSYFWADHFNVICLYQNMHNWYKLAERTISQKNLDKLLYFSLSCSCNLNLSSLWLESKTVI